MYIIGENIQILSPKVKEALANHDATYIREMARKQVEHGASMVDVNIPAQARWDRDYALARRGDL